MLCDVCNNSVTEDTSKSISPERFRQLERGFGVNETNVKMIMEAGLGRSQAVQMLTEQYKALQSNWLLCLNCYAKANEIDGQAAL